jgi:hypothetical protein
VLDTPQGKLAQLVFTLSVKETLALKLAANAADGARKAALSSLDTKPPTHNWLVKCFEGLPKAKVIKEIPAHWAIPCHMKVTEGFLYLMEEGILFLTKTTWIPFDDIARIAMDGGSSRDFELHVELHSTKKVIEFRVDKKSQPPVAKFLAEVHARAAKEAAESGDAAPTDGAAMEEGEAMDEESEDDESGEEDSDEDDSDAEEMSHAQLLAEGDDDEDDAFDPEAEVSSDSGSGSDSEAASEDDAANSDGGGPA